MAAVRAAVPPDINGVLDDEAWRQGTAAEGLWLTDAQRAPADQTTVVTTYDDTALYFAFTALDARPDLMGATQSGRNALDDLVTVEVGSRHDHGLVSRFTVTVHGVRSGTMADAHAPRPGRAAWRAAAQRTPQGWTAELAIPFELLDYDPAAGTLALNFARYQHRTRESSEWASVARGRLTLERGQVANLQSPERRADDTLAIRHYLSGGRDLDTGFDLRHQWRGALTSVVAVHPDFSIVDAGVPGLGFSHTEKYVSDRRPFFRDGADFFGSGEVFHSGRIDTFDVGLKTFGRVDGYQVGLLAVTTVDGERTNYVGRIAREVRRGFDLSATLVGREHATGHADTLQVHAGGRIGTHLRVDADLARSSGDGTAPGGRRRGEIAYRASHFYSGVWADHTDPEYLPAMGFLAGDIMGTVGRGTYAGYTRSFGSWTRQADVSVAYDTRDTLTGLPQRESMSVYAGLATAANVRFNTGVTSGVYRPRGPRPGEWTDALNEDRFYLASAFYESPGGRFGYGAQYSWGVGTANEYDSLAPSVWVAPSSRLLVSYSFERATDGVVHQQHVLSGNWQITPEQSIAGRWVDYDGGYYKLSYRRALAHGVDAVGVYTADPYVASSLDLKLIWSLQPSARN